MDRFIKFIKSHYILITAFLLAVITRLIWINTVPNAIGGDELVYITTAKSIIASGKDISGIWNPFSIFTFNYPPHEMQAELPYFLQIPALFLLRDSLFAARITNIMFSIATIILIYLITKKFTDEITASITALIMAINPWSIFIARSAYETPAAVFFILLSIYIIISVKGNKILWTIPTFILAFYSYIATKVIILPVAIISILMLNNINALKKNKKYYLAVITALLVLIVFFVLRTYFYSTTGRYGDFLLPNSNYIVSKVNLFRSATISNFYSDKLINKYTVYLDEIFRKFLNIFSVNYLFTQGDEFFAINTHGLFYFIDAIFMLFGLIFINKTNKKIFWYLLLIILISVIPQLIHKNPENFSQHNALIFPFMIILIGVGITGVFKELKYKSWQIFYITVLSGIYFFSLVNFFNVYAFRQTKLNYSDFDIRTLSQYLTLAQKLKYPIVVRSTKYADLFKKYIYYSANINSQTATVLKNININNDIKFGSITFTSCTNKVDNNTVTEIIDNMCDPQTPTQHLSIRQLSDGGIRYFIYNDKLCQKYILGNYVTNLKLTDFNLEDMNDMDYCQKYISVN
jgi:4-amino-4-deoxy-L-arabinose transferase-like glycosyltransferase